MLIFDTSDGENIVAKDIVKKKTLAIIPMGESTRLLLDILTSHSIFGIDGKVYDHVDPFRKD